MILFHLKNNNQVSIFQFYNRLDTGSRAPNNYVFIFLESLFKLREMMLYVYNNQMTEEKQNTGTKAVFQTGYHTFLLRRVDSQNNSFVQVDFSPITLPQPSVNAPDNLNICPVFNKDCHYFTPAFILPLEQRKTQKYQDTYLRLHEERRTQMSQQRDELFVPKPSKSNSYCCICKTAFDDYLTHINMPSHCSNSQASTFVNDIIALTSQFNAKADPLLSKKLYGKSRKIKKCVRKGKKNCTINGYLSSTTICNQQIL